MLSAIKKFFVKILVPICRLLVLRRFAKLKFCKLTVRELYAHNDTPLGYRQIVFGDENTSLHSTISIVDPVTYIKFALKGSIGGGSAYAEGLWDSQDLLTFLRIMGCNVNHSVGFFTKVFNYTNYLKHLFFKRNSIDGAKNNVLAHYDLSNSFFKSFLDKRMQYSSGVIEEEDDSLEQMGLNKFIRICESLGLSEGDNVLEIGCGWGHLAIYMAKNYKVNVTAITISEAQLDYCLELLSKENEDCPFDLTEYVNFISMDYRELTDDEEMIGKFDHVVSIEMIEQVGEDYLDDYFSIVSDVLTEGGYFFLQAITIPEVRYERYKHTVDFIREFIFPGGHLPTSELIDYHAENNDLELDDHFSITQDYARTCKLWEENIQVSDHYLLGDNYFYRLWEFYLLYCSAGFKEEAIGCEQTVFRKV